MSLFLGTLVLALICLADAQSFRGEQRARNLTVIHYPRNVTVSFKEPRGVCKTAFDRQKQYTGWVNVPSEHPTNIFFYFVQAREKSDSLTIWLNGGPGASSMYGFFTGAGPCEVVEAGLDRYETVAREWGWDRASNMLFIDQPSQTGFSYDTPTDATISLMNDTITMPPIYKPGHIPPWDLVNGTLSSGNRTNEVNTTEAAALAVWHVMQGFLKTLPKFKLPLNLSSLSVSLFAESYGGKYGPIFAEMWQAQNQKLKTGALDRDSAVEIHLSSLGIISGWVDIATEIPGYIRFLHNNTYGIKAASSEEADSMLRNFTAIGGDRDLLAQCAAMARQYDPTGTGNQAQVNDACTKGMTIYDQAMAKYATIGRSSSDLAEQRGNTFPPYYFVDYLNQAAILDEIGSPINFSTLNFDVYNRFYETGDYARGGNIARLAKLLNSGVRIGLVHGDRDFSCNWFGGEAVSLSIAQQAEGDYSIKFPAAGYEPIRVNKTYIGGEVRQFGNLSFSRIYQAGHAIPSYQPETAFQVFSRILTGKSVSTGKEINMDTFGTKGPLQSTTQLKLPDQTSPTCFVRVAWATCTDKMIRLAKEGGGAVINGVLYNSTQDWSPARVPVSTPTSHSAESVGKGRCKKSRRSVTSRL
ncbi:hypothetical protein DCS_05784 [Drechmeria coniospora]|uniref:Carboxypeptidase n=1 Tax=Drechmeria coniospora TaxID=98403 RepID=A0A151GNU6_DRECN|nr:hypothetical protein DCS_05784 [Drechmeria coniospora]KYK58766.1 hypothetical protein DCS_05784 [Drechmeria coniospora]